MERFRGIRLRESAMAPFNEGHLLSGGGIGVGYPVFIEINDHGMRAVGNSLPHERYRLHRC